MQRPWGRVKVACCRDNEEASQCGCSRRESVGSDVRDGEGSGSIQGFDDYYRNQRGVPKSHHDSLPCPALPCLSGR